MSVQIAALFPGQGSQVPGMGKSLAAAFWEAAAVFDEASEVLGVDVRALLWESPASRLAATENAQPALVIAGVAAWRVLERRGVVLRAVAGHSVGALAALVATGRLNLAEAVSGPLDTVRAGVVMGGADWQRWIAALAAKGLLGEGFRTVRPYYRGPGRDGWPGLDLRHQHGGNSGIQLRSRHAPVPQPAARRHGLRPSDPARAGGAAVGPAHWQCPRWSWMRRVASGSTTWNRTPGVQAEVTRRWHDATQETIGELADTTWFWSQFRRLYGFGLPGIDYAAEVETDVPWPDPEKLT